jgi:hypothetical protein
MFIFSASIVTKKMNTVKKSFPIAWLRQLVQSQSGALAAIFPAARAALSTERLGGLVLARIARVFLDLARQNLGDADRVGDGIGGSLLALRSLRHLSINFLSFDNDRPRLVPAECRRGTASKNLGERELSSG